MIEIKNLTKVYKLNKKKMMELKTKDTTKKAADNVSLTDQEIATQMKELIYKEFQKESLSQLSMEQRLTLCSLLKKNFRAGAKQIARISHLPLHIVEQIV
jgi:homoaconitase/3-isopropylmalate dehydratase large subunit